MSDISAETRRMLVEAMEIRVNQQTPPEALRDLAECCRSLGVYAGQELADKILVEVQYRASSGTLQNLPSLAETWALLQPPARVVDLVTDSEDNEHTRAG